MLWNTAYQLGWDTYRRIDISGPPYSLPVCKNQDNQAVEKHIQQN